MISLTTIPVRFCPSKDVLKTLNERNWVCSFSGGKDSTALVTWIEWLRRIGMVRVATPRLVMSDTTVEFPFLRGIADRLMAALAKCGWECQVVTPPVNQRLYCRIFGIGVTPVHPGNRTRMRWCSRATKINPMTRYAKTLAEDVLQLSGVRWGESDVRDGKLKAKGCAAGGECGLPEPGDRVTAPIITWKMCQVIDWLSGREGVADAMPDTVGLTRELVEVYNVKTADVGFLTATPPPSTALRFGCIGCPAISNVKVTRSKEAANHPEWSHLRRIYGVWDALYNKANRCCRLRTDTYRKQNKNWPKGWNPDYGYGPLRMEARKQYFPEILDIQDKAKVTLVTPEDIAFVHECWEKKVYPRGWSEADESVQPPPLTWM